MNKLLTRIWLNHPSFDDAVKSGDGKYLTIITTTSRDVEEYDTPGVTIKIGKVGQFNSYCDKYEVVDSESGSNWKEFAELKYDKGCLHITPKGEWFSMDMPVVVR